MKFSKKALCLIFFALLSNLVFAIISYAQVQNNQSSDSTHDSSEEDNVLENDLKNSEPPEVELNGQKIIFNKKPLLDEEGWLFPIEEIASKLHDKVSVDIVNGLITVQRFSDKSTVQLNVKNGLIVVNNRPFRTLFGYSRIVLGIDSQMVPLSALALLLGLTTKDDEEGRLVLQSTFSAENTVGTVHPQARKGLRDLLVDYLTVTNSFDLQKPQGLFARRTEVNSGFHNDDFAITSDLIVRSGTGAPFVNFDSGNFSYYRNASPFQIHFGDKPLSLIKSPLLGGIVLRGLQLQTKAPWKDSRFVFSSGFLPTSGKVLGQGLSFVKYGRSAEIAEWSSSPKKNWQFSIGEAVYDDFITNQLVRTKQAGSVLALTATKSGKYLEGDSNFALGLGKDKITGESFQGQASNVLLRWKPTKWLSFFTKGAYYSPGFYPLSGNPFYHDRNELTGGINISPPRSNIGFSQSVGKFNLANEKPDDYNVTNIYGSSTPFKRGPTFLLSYSMNQSQISSTKAIDDLIFPINESNIQTIDFDTLIERRTNSFFRATILKSWTTFNFTASYNHFTFSENSLLKSLSLEKENISELATYDLSLNKNINRILGLNSYLLGSDLYKQVRFGINIGPVLDDKLILQLQTGALLRKDSDPSPIFTVNLNYSKNKRSLYSLNFTKTAFYSTLAGLYQYNLKPVRGGFERGIVEEYSIGGITGKVIVLEENLEREKNKNNIILPVSAREKSLADVRVHLGNYTVMTDAKGLFQFPSLTPGIYSVRIEYSDLPSYLTSITPEAVDVKVEAGKQTSFNFVLAYFGSINGKLKFVDHGNKVALQDIRVYLDQSEFETLTNHDGTFELGDVKPGKYKLKIDPDFLPDELESASEDIEIVVRGKDKLLNIEVPVKLKEKTLDIKEF